MNKIVNIKYLTQNNGYWQYERRVPKAVLSHPYWGSKKAWRRSLGLKVNASVKEVISAWEVLHKTFEKSLCNIKEKNFHILDRPERRQRAEVHLKMFSLSAHDGSLEGIDGSNERKDKSKYIDNVRRLSGAFIDYINWERWNHGKMREKGNGLLPRVHIMPPEVQLQREAWNAYTEERSLRKLFIFRDLWEIYASGKQLDMKERKNQKTFRRWVSFVSLAEDEVLTNQSLNDRLRVWIDAQKVRKIRDQTLKRELGVIRAVLNYARQAETLDLQWVLPRLTIKTEQKQRPIIPKDTYRLLWALIRDQTDRKYQPWKEFILTILCQSSAVMSELMRLERHDIHLEAATSHISLYDMELKTKDRKRIVPLPFRVKRLQELLEQMDQGQPTALPPSLVTMTNNGYQWATSESNINHQLNSYFKVCDTQQQGFTTYSTRHSFRFYLHSVDTNPIDILYLKGFAGNSHLHKSYGLEGIGSADMVKSLETTASRAMNFLNQDDQTMVQLCNS